MHPVEREPQSASARLIAQYRELLPYTSFYRFGQLLEQSLPDAPVTGSSWQVRQEPVRFRPHPGMGFPAGEIRGVEEPEHPHLPPSVRINFMGLYGVESPLPSHYIDDIAQQREGYEATADFLDIFNHRLIAQYYRIWRKYSYPATFEAGGQDRTSQYLLGLAGLGISGCAQNIATPVSRFLALLPVMLLPGRTAEGLVSLVRLLAPGTQGRVWHHDRRRIPLNAPVTMSVRQPVSLKGRPVMGEHATDVNGQVLLQLTTGDAREAQGWLPGGRLHTDLLALLHVYLGSRLDVRMQLCVDRALLPDAQICCRTTPDSPQLGRTAILKPLTAGASQPPRPIIISLGRYQRVQENHQRKETHEDGDYRW
ncbi:TPA: type VI secretion system baseplate subunit TssG [Enterobacter cloacae]|uniref:type VI secretion system baseplate subunit TssG n=1 Tax=Enterobacter cloacae TaxID=550 RepID=UPI00296C391E|nr:type VI secretion system baseplate subunit TssG [Enterobacter cloacae]HCM9268381.1 type VI secretion system baseplate subunit TssG [Enterobacter cloacae subsp. cloacae]EJD6660455.1 type VI secretion system baseplate subunit TssG [Enterobacter cloacae]HAS1023856.1 type VI secretion system baseplate subunit TssG [Enterobacter cloacae]HAS1024375.1 type VI secretion system baseplate subunit TssG [Enterobacter cloacae]